MFYLSQVEERGCIYFHLIFNDDNATSTKMNVIIQNLTIIFGSETPESS